MECQDSDDGDADVPRAYCFIPSVQPAMESLTAIITPKDPHHTPVNIVEGSRSNESRFILSRFSGYYYLFRISHPLTSGEVRVQLIDLFHVE